MALVLDPLRPGEQLHDAGELDGHLVMVGLN